MKDLINGMTLPRGLKIVAAVGLCLILVFPSCLGMGIQEKKHRELDAEVRQMKEDIRKLKADVAEAKKLAEMELRRIRPARPIVPMRTSELPIDDRKP